MQKYIEPFIDSREAAKMIDKEHNKLLRDVRRYVKQLGEANIGQSDFFQESTYKDNKGEERPCYNITKKGCEFIAHKLTGTKGTIFTARYINRFHEMEDIINSKTSEPGLPWFIHSFRNKYIMLFRDFETITGVHLSGNYTSLKRQDHLTGGHDYNGWGWHTVTDKEKFKQEYGFDYGDDDCMMYLYPCGIIKAVDILMKDKTVHIKQETYKMLTDGIKSINLHNRVNAVEQTQRDIIANDTKRNLPVNISITISSEKEGCRHSILL